MPRTKKIVKLAAPWMRVFQYCKLHRYQATAAGIGILILLLLAFPFRFLVMPALVNGQPIWSWNYVGKLHQQAGQQVLDQMISEALIEQEIRKQGIQVTAAEVDQQVAEINDQLGESSGGLEAVLALQGISRDEFMRQVRLNLAMEKLVAGTIQISEEEIAQELKDNGGTATTAADNLRSQKLREAFGQWFDNLKAGAKIHNFVVNPPVDLSKLPKI
ncbi:MAG: hypothetical protein A2784_03150 [Candidatus Chisholmbacteria bacterium RIFCSPHIGHO2_01_FULL_48_12]|uniref:peptidylprolyl isomerase n=1 Tax=Candidatus Chisholmbacteria bacterium RIFCSPHIGHO2_01_FULL_48_12 TaxID=1797589 RepID=A0A1G1VK52_9BACT|nr:MAG: hypothetical protein A2784_03150 [Candidatus Chisholmbacteria bacterium RIFCSPHIGHO2_01_FULL_48_12]